MNSRRAPREPPPALTGAPRGGTSPQTFHDMGSFKCGRLKQTNRCVFAGVVAEVASICDAAAVVDVHDDATR